MFIRRTKTSTATSGEDYFTFRLVASVRKGDKVMQKTLVNLGRNFELPKDLWPDLCSRIDQILEGTSPLLPINEAVENEAQRIYAKIIATGSESLLSVDIEKVDYQQVDVDSLELFQPRSVGAEHVSLEALKELRLPEMLDEAGFNGPQKAAALGNIIGRMCQPQSELATYRWLTKTSALGELIGFDYDSFSLMQLYRASDQLLKNQAAIEEHLFERVQDIFQFTPTVTLYDLTNTYFEGKAEANPKAKRGRSKEKRNDCPLITLGMALDESGFVRRSQVFDGNVSEGLTLAIMLEKLNTPKGALVVMDAGISSDENLNWLIENGYKYLVVSRERKRHFDMDSARSITSASGHDIHLQRADGTLEGEVKLYCWSAQRAEKENGINERFREKYEAQLDKIAAGLSKPRGTKKRDKINERIGRLKQNSKGIGQHYRVDLSLDKSQEMVIGLDWYYEPKAGSKQTHPGVYCLRSNETSWDDEKLWQTYTMLTDLEAVFRSLKSDLALRPVYHHKESRCDGHLFITVLAYQAVQLIRRKLKDAGINESWSSLRKILEIQRRITASFKQSDGRTLHLRKSTQPESELAKIYRVLNVSPNPGGIKKTLF